MDKTFLKGLTLIQTLAGRETPSGVTELARELRLTKSNVHRLLQALVARRFARKLAGGQYELTTKIWELGWSVLGRLDVKQVAAPFLRELAEKTQETVHLSILDGSEVVYIDKIDSSQPVRAYSHVGGRAPAYAVATGKALLAWQSPSVVIDVLGNGRLKKFTRHTAASTKEVQNELKRVRERGFAANRGEWRETVCGLAAPIRDATGAVVAAVGISGPSERLRPRALSEFAPIVTKTAEAISAALGFQTAPVRTVALSRSLERKRERTRSRDVLI